jgi:hypothetical protein
MSIVLVRDRGDRVATLPWRAVVDRDFYTACDHPPTRHGAGSECRALSTQPTSLNQRSKPAFLSRTLVYCITGLGSSSYSASSSGANAYSLWRFM